MHRRDHVDAHLLAGEDVDRRAVGAAEAACCTCTPSTTATLPWADIDMDFMNLNQSAHGDREFGFIVSRMRLTRKVVVGHWQDPECSERIGVWTRAALRWHEAQHCEVARFGDNMREVAVTEGDKVEAQLRLGYSVNGYGVGDLADARARMSSDAESRRARHGLRARSTASLPNCARAASAHESLRDAARIELGICAHFSTTAASMAFTDTFEDLARHAAAARHRRAAHDGRRLRLRRRRRLEDRGARAADESHGDGLEGGTSFMEDYTYHLGAGGTAGPRRAHARNLPVHRIGSAEVRVHPLSIGGKADPVRLVFTAPPGPGITVGLIDLGNRFRMVVNEVDVVAPDAACRSCPWRTRCGCRDRHWRLRPSAGCSPADRTTPASRRRSRSRLSRTSPRLPASS